KPGFSSRTTGWGSILGGSNTTATASAISGSASSAWAAGWRFSPGRTWAPRSGSRSPLPDRTRRPDRKALLTYAGAPAGRPGTAGGPAAEALMRGSQEGYVPAQHVDRNALERLAGHARPEQWLEEGRAHKLVAEAAGQLARQVDAAACQNGECEVGRVSPKDLEVELEGT